MASGFTRFEARILAGLALAVLAGIVIGRWIEGTPAEVVPITIRRPDPTPAPTPQPTAQSSPRIAPEFLPTPEPTPTSAPEPVAAVSAGGLLDINAASQAQLEALPGIGPTKARAIIVDRANNGPFQSVEALDRVSGIGPKTVEALRPMITVGGAVPSASAPAAPAAPANPRPRVAINSATLAELDALDGVGPVIAQRILDFRASKGRIRNERDLLAIRGIGSKIVEQNRDRIVYD